MDYELNDIQKSIQQTFRKFVDNKVKPLAAEILGFFGMRYPESAGGSGLDILSYSLAVIELARGSLSFAAVCAMQSLMATYFLYRFGEKKIKEDYFNAALKGEKIGAICMTEPDAGLKMNNMY